MRFLRRSESATDSSNTGLEKGVYPSALRITAPLFPSVATIVMVITYLVGDEIVQITGVTGASWKATAGDFAVLIGLLAGILIWFTVAASGCSQSIPRRVGVVNGVESRSPHTVSILRTDVGSDSAPC